MAVAADRRVDRAAAASAASRRRARGTRAASSRRGRARCSSSYASSERATTSSPDVSRSRRWTIPGRSSSPPVGAGERERLRERAAGVPGRRMHDDTGRLVDDEEMLVLVRDRRARAARRRAPRQPAGGSIAISSPPASLWLLPRDCPVDEHGTRFEQPLGRAARADLRQPGEIAVEPLARGLRRDDEPLQRLGTRGSRSARTSAARRMPTPITMKLSARLNAGQ